MPYLTMRREPIIYRRMIRCDIRAVTLALRRISDRAALPVAPTLLCTCSLCGRPADAFDIRHEFKVAETQGAARGLLRFPVEYRRGHYVEES